MTYNSETDDELLRGLLLRSDDAMSTEDTDEADELMALFLEGQLRGDDRTAFFHHLDAHPNARKALGCGLTHMEQRPVLTSSAPRTAVMTKPWISGRITAVLKRLRELFSPLPRRRFAYAAAVLLLLGTSTVMWFASNPPTSAQLIASRGGPDDFGISADLENVTTPMGPGSQRQSGLIPELVATISDEVERDQLQKAYLFLDRNQLDKAHEAFAVAVEKYPQSYLAWLGRGNTYFKGKRREDFPAAESAYRSALKLYDHGDGARKGLAMVLTMQGGRDQEALAEWNRVEIKLQPKKQREDIIRAMDRLQRAMNK